MTAHAIAELRSAQRDGGISAGRAHKIEERLRAVSRGWNVTLQLDNARSASGWEFLVVGFFSIDAETQGVALAGVRRRFQRRNQSCANPITRGFMVSYL